MDPDDASALRGLISAAIRRKNHPYHPDQIDSGRAEVAQAVIDAIEDAGWKLVRLRDRRPGWWFRWLFRPTSPQ